MTNIYPQSASLPFIVSKLLNACPKVIRACSRLLIFCLLMYSGGTQAQIAVRGTATSAISQTSSLTIAKPAGVVAGDVMMVTISQYFVNIGFQTATVSLNGWTSVGNRQFWEYNNNRLWGAVLYRVADGSEGNDFTFPLNANATKANAGQIVAFSGVNTKDGYRAIDVNGGGPFDINPTDIRNAEYATYNYADGITTVTPNTAIVMLSLLGINGQIINNPPWRLESNPYTFFTKLNETQALLNSVSTSVAAAVIQRPQTGFTGPGVAFLSAQLDASGRLYALRPMTLTTGSVTTSICAGNTVTVPFTSTGNYINNTYIAQLSNAAGSFASPVNIGSLASNANAGNITATIPAGTPTGAAYRIRVISSFSTPYYTDNGANLTVNAQPVITGAVNTNIGATINLTPTSGGTWTSSNPAVATISSSGVVTPISSGSVTFTFVSATAPFCSNSATILVNKPTLTANKTSICPNEQVTLTALPSLGTATYNFKVNGISQQNTASNIFSTTTLANGASVTVELTYSGNTSVSLPVVITVNPVPTGTLSAAENSGTANDNTVCAGTPVTFTATAGFVNYNFKIGGVSMQSGPSNVFTTVPVANPSLVTVEVTNASNCVNTFNLVAITVNANPTGSLTAAENSGTANDNNICGGSTVTFTATGGFTNYAFFVNGGAAVQNGTSNIFSSTTLPDGAVVTVNATNSNGCTAGFNPVTITVVASPTGTLTVSAFSVCSGEEIIFTATAGFSNYTFRVNGNIAQNGSANTFSSSTLASNDVVTVTATNINTCSTLFNSITVTINPLPTGLMTLQENSGIAPNDAMICAGAVATFTAPGGFSNYNFLVNGSSVQNSASNIFTSTTLTNGSAVRVAVTNGSNCSNLLNIITVTIHAIPTVSIISGAAAVCVNSSISLSNTTTGGSWTSSNTAVASVSAAGVVTGISNGTTTISYTTAANANGCTNTASKIITVNALPVLPAISGPADVCVNSTIQLTNAVNAGTWSSSNTAVATVSTTGLVTGFSDGSASISYSITDGNSCAAMVTKNISVHAVPVVAPIAGPAAVCIGNNITLTNATTGGSWTSSNTAVATINASTGSINGLSAGSTVISYTVINIYNCTTVVTANVAVNPLPVPTLSGPNPICPGSTGVYVTEAGQSNYVWTVVGGTVTNGGSSLDNTITINWNQPGTKNVLVNYTNSNGCQGAASVAVTSTTGTVPVITGPATVCNNTTTNIYSTQAGQTLYEWAVTGGTITAGGTAADNTATITWTTAGTQNVQVNFTNGSGCTAASASIFPVTIRPLPVSAISGTTAVCVNNPAPQLSFTGSDGTAPYTFYYSINGGATQQLTTVSGNSVTLPVSTTTAGTYTYTLMSVADNNSCSQNQTGTATITVNSLPTAAISGTTAVCQGTANPSVTFTGSNGTAPYTFTYTINAGSPQTVTTVAGNTVTVAAATATAGIFTYNLTNVSDANTCGQSQAASAVITVNPLPTLTINQPAAVCSPNTVDLTAAGITAGSTAGISLLYYTDAAATIPYNNPATAVAGTYYIKGSTTAGCFVIRPVTVVVNATPTVVINQPAPVCSPTTVNLALAAITTGSTAGLTFTYFTNPAGTNVYATPTAATAGTYYIKGSTTAGCSDIKPVTIVVNATPTLLISNPAPVCNPTTVSLSSTIAAGTTPGLTFGYFTDAAATNVYASPTAATAGTYYIKGSTAAGCFDIKPVVVTVSNRPTASIAGTTTICSGSSATLVLTVTGSGTISGTLSNGQAFSGTAPTINILVSPTTNTTYTVASLTDGNCASLAGDRTGAATISVTPLPSVPVVTPNAASICAGSVQTLYSGVTGTSTVWASPFVNYGGGSFIPDNDPVGAQRDPITITTANIPANAVITNILVGIRINHGKRGDLRVNLKAPNGKVINLINHKGGTGANFFGTRFTNQGGASLIGATDFDNIFAPDAVLNVEGATRISNNVSNTTQFSDLFTNPQGVWYISVRDAIPVTQGGDLDSWYMNITYTVPTGNAVTWSPSASLYTDPGATVAYTGQQLTTVYAKPSATTTYMASNGPAGCSSSKAVTVTVNPIPVVSIAADYCAVTNGVRLTASSVPAGASFLWSTGATTATVDVTAAQRYEVSATFGSCTGSNSIDFARNLIVNGDFGDVNNINFQSSYTRDQGEDALRFGGRFALGSEAFYHSSVDATYPYFYGRDRTYGYGNNFPYLGNYMIVNGSNLAFVWQQTINVQPNTTYYFSAYGRSMNANGTPFAKLRFAINDVQTGTTANLVPGVNDNVNNPWPASGRFGGSWTSGPTTTTAKITVLDLETSTIQTANDFGLDDISFGTLSSFVALESVFGTDAQSKCINTPIDNIVYNVGNGSTTAPVITGLPVGVTAVQTGDKVTISGTPPVAGIFNYSITTQGSCNSTVTTGSITVTSQTIAVTAGVVSPTVCINTPLNIGYTIGGTATGIGTITGLPAGLTVSAITNKSFTITGSPTAAGVYAYTIPTTDITGCAAATISGTISVQAQSISLTSANASQVVCINTQIANVQYTVSGTATSATVSGLPTGLNVTYNSGLLFIAGTPTQAGSFNFTVTTSGGCTPVTTTGNITVTPQAGLALSSGSNTQTVCANTAIANIVYNVSAATGATVTGLPAGLTGSYNSGMFTISGTTSAQGTFNYTVTTSGGCGAGSATGAISIQSQTLQLSSGIASPSICANTPIQNIVYSFGGSATGATVSGLPAGINGILSGNTVTISGATAAQGSYPYQVTSSGSCSNVIANGVITIQPSAAGGALTSLAVCNGGSGTLTVADQVGAIIRWEYSINGGSSWITIANTNITQSFTNITSPRLYRVVVGNNCGQAISSVAAVSLNNYWTGAADGNWNNPANWSSNQLPSAAGACPATYIMAGMPNQPVLNSGTASIRDLVIANGANLTVNGTGTLQLSGTITNNGIFNIASGRLELNGTTAQQVSGNMFAGKMVGSLVNSNPAGISAAAAPADTLKIRSSLSFGNVSNSFTQTNNNITLVSTATLTAGVGKVLNGNVINGSVNAERFVNMGRKWRLMAVPVNTPQSFKSSWMENATAAQNPVPGYGMQVTDFRSSWAANGFDNLSAGGPSVKSYNPLTGLYEGITNTANAIDTRSGYMSFIRGDRTAGVSGSNSASTVLRLKGLVRQGTQPAVIIPSTRFAVVGNPYPSAIDLRQVNRTNTTLDLYVWDPSLGGSYGLGAFRTLALNEFTNNYETVPGGEVYNFLESGQAFFVRARNGDGSVTFDEQDKTDTIDNNIAFFTSGNASRLRIDLSIANAGNPVLADGVMASFSGDAGAAVDFDDAIKITNTGENVSLKRDGNLLAIERRPTIEANDTLYLDLTGVRYQGYRWNISAQNMDAPGLQGWLVDQFNATSTALDLAGNTSYEFEINTNPGSYAVNRFMIVFKPAVVLPVTMTNVAANRTSETAALVSWKTAAEVNMANYIVEKSSDGISFSSTGSVLPQHNSAGTGAYSFTDNNAGRNAGYYRIKAVSRDGQVQYSNIVRINAITEPALAFISVYPNPVVNKKTAVRFTNCAAGTYQVELLGSNGQVIFKKAVVVLGNDFTQQIVLPGITASGVYRLQAYNQGDKKIFATQLMIE